VRAVAAYDFEGQRYQATPMPTGYALFFSQERAKIFAEYLLAEQPITLYVDPKRPKRALFVDLNAGM